MQQIFRGVMLLALGVGFALGVCAGESWDMEEATGEFWFWVGIVVAVIGGYFAVRYEGLISREQSSGNRR